MNAIILTIRGEGPNAFVVPRRLHVELRPGKGELCLPSSPPLDDACRESIGFAWKSACRLANRFDQDCIVSIVSPAPVQGWSAGVTFGLVALSKLLDSQGPEEGFFATGGVMNATGTLAGGLAALEKARAASGLAEQLGKRNPFFFMPPTLDPPRLKGLKVVMATDLGSAYGHLDPGGYEKIRGFHLASRRAIDVSTHQSSRTEAGPFVVVSHKQAKRLPRRIDGIEIVASDSSKNSTGWAEFGEKGKILWSIHWPRDCPGVELEQAIPAYSRLARKHSLL